MIGFRFRIEDLPEQPGEKKVPFHWLFLPFGLALLAFGMYGLHNYFRLHGPLPAQLHEIKLSSITNVVAEPEIPGSKSIDYIWLTSSNGVKIHYREKFPYSKEVLDLNTNYGLMLDSTNKVWGVTTTNGAVLARSYFEDYNIEAKMVGKYCGGFLAIFGAWILLTFFACEHQIRAGKPMKNQMEPVRLRMLILFGSLFGYLILCFAAIFPLLSNKLPTFAVALLWVLGGGLIGNGIVSYFKKHPPRQ